MVKPLKNTPTNGNTQRKLANRAAIKQLYTEEYTYREIANILSISIECVKKHMKEIKNRDLGNDDFVNLASKAVKSKLKEGNLQAAKMVYDRVHPTINVSVSKTEHKHTGNIELSGILDELAYKPPPTIDIGEPESHEKPPIPSETGSSIREGEIVE
jgi:DNA-binding CsgD family transcriptional regulator